MSIGSCALRGAIVGGGMGACYGVFASPALATSAALASWGLDRLMNGHARSNIDRAARTWVETFIVVPIVAGVAGAGVGALAGATYSVALRVGIAMMS